MGSWRLAVGSLKLAQKINLEAQKVQKVQKVFLQVNISKDCRKAGFLERDLIHNIYNICYLKNILVEGLMTIPANHQNEALLRSDYAATRKLKNKITTEGLKSCQNLSMGMSDDYLYAIQEGATHIRLGTSLFGQRKR